MRSHDKSLTKSQSTEFSSCQFTGSVEPETSVSEAGRSDPLAVFETLFTPLYAGRGKPAKPIRLMVGLSILKHMENLSDDVLVQRWVQNPYYQAFAARQGERSEGA